MGEKQDLRVTGNSPREAIVENLHLKVSEQPSLNKESSFCPVKTDLSSVWSSSEQLVLLLPSVSLSSLQNPIQISLSLLKVEKRQKKKSAKLIFPSLGT